MSVEESQPLISHLIELRNRLLRAVICILVVFCILVYWANDIYTLLSSPLTERLPEGATMIATNVVTPFFTPIKLTAIVAVFISVPYILYQVWAFIAPALYKHEKKLVYPLLISSSLLFYIGVAFAYYVVFPLIFGFLTQTAPEGVVMATDINSYLDFILTIFLAFGVCFEVPVAIILLCWSGVTAAEDLKEKRPYIIVAAFVIGMLLTPPDMFSQTLLAVPMCLLFELGLLVTRFYQPKDDETDSTAQSE
ncbi:twin-arginine translocase subunit TatC [Glaesserella parasuis]|uniref:twin-arginine translocase subunit TatC n=1 Tax=Glaesserella parasuis TaxID=738 RepID=UPI0003AC0BF1|nr:twin-arginine translocase subunit TatC [Glaesserella parasuis]ATW42620.1 twin arginine-targeting protein translocase TatC [Glaesserella parasuis D74]EQA09131.1 twin arginine-targeting protein translocase TatC [Glaesserella parasuis D74]MDP0318588.1 twin-arginine translocase subunit TatC [Glaesserella parasuis]